MSRKVSTIIKRLEERRWAALRSAPPPDIATATLTLLEDFKILDHEGRSIKSDDYVGQQLLWWEAIAVMQYFLTSQGQESPTLNALINALQDTTAGVASEKRLAHPARNGKTYPVAYTYARAQVIAVMNKASPGQQQELLKAAVIHLNRTPERVKEMMKNYHNDRLTNRMLCKTVERIEHQLDRGYGPDLDGLREARLLV